jgi:hypothetical protein
MSRAPIASIDFDGTIVEHMFPGIGQPLPGAIETMKKLQEQGWLLILNTCREDEPGGRPYLTEAVEFMREHGIEFRSVNENLPSDEFRNPIAKRRKPYADVYIDDRNLGGFPGWAAVAEELLDGGG